MEFITAKEACEYLGITPNNLHQIQYRKQLNWVEKKGKFVFYDFEQVKALKAKRQK